MLCTRQRTHDTYPGLALLTHSLCASLYTIEGGSLDDTVSKIGRRGGLHRNGKTTINVYLVYLYARTGP